MGLIAWAKRKTEMTIVAWLFERVFKNYITTVLGFLLGFAGVVAAVYNLIPTTLDFHGYNVANTMLGAAGVAVALAGIIAKDQHIGINPPTLPTKLGMLLLGLLVLPTAAKAQTETDTLPTNIYSVGASYNNGATQPMAGTAMYAHLAVQSTKTYAFSVLDVLPISKKPFTVSTNIGAGLAQQLLEVNGVKFYMPTSAGVSIAGSNTGWSWTGGILADYAIKRKGMATKWNLQPNVRWIKSSVSNGSGYQLIGGFNLALAN